MLTQDELKDIEIEKEIAAIEAAVEKESFSRGEYRFIKSSELSN
jgi:hypothetical protein